MSLADHTQDSRVENGKEWMSRLEYLWNLHIFRSGGLVGSVNGFSI